MNIYCTERFESNFVNLQKNNSYSEILNDICTYFLDKNISELHITKDIIHNAKGKYSLNKYRIMNSKMNKGKSSSYRCIAVCLPEMNILYLGAIYPKTGSDSIDNLTKEEYKEIAGYIKDTINNRKYKILDLNQRKLVEIGN
jgi:hypothetical protein